MESEERATTEGVDKGNEEFSDKNERYPEIVKKIEKIEAMLLDIEARLNVIEKALQINMDPVLKKALELSKVEISLTLGLLRNSYVIASLPMWLRDDISLSIIISLIEGPKSVSQITEKVKEMRGRASRRIISERLKTLETKKIVKCKKKGRSKIYFLSLPPFARGSSSSQRSSSGPS